MSRKKQFEAEMLEAEIDGAFANVRKDVQFLLELIKVEKRKTDERFGTLEREVRGIGRQLRKNHVHLLDRGVIVPTIRGKVDAIAKHLGLEFGVEPRVVTPTKVTASKAKKASKK